MKQRQCSTCHKPTWVHNKMSTEYVDVLTCYDLTAYVRPSCIWGCIFHRAWYCFPHTNSSKRRWLGRGNIQETKQLFKTFYLILQSQETSSNTISMHAAWLNNLNLTNSPESHVPLHRSDSNCLPRREHHLIHCNWKAMEWNSGEKYGKTPCSSPSHRYEAHPLHILRTVLPGDKHRHCSEK